MSGDLGLNDVWIDAAAEPIWDYSNPEYPIRGGDAWQECRDLARQALEAAAPLIVAATGRETEREHGERIAQALEVAAGHRCPTCRGKAGSTTYKGGWGSNPTSRCGGGHTWSGPRGMDVHEAASIARTTGIGDQP